MQMEAENLVSKAEEINGVKVLIVRQKDQPGNGLKNFAETMRNKMGSGVVFVSNESAGKVTFVCAAAKDAVGKGIKAGDIVKAAAQLTGGNGGGRPDMAQAGGKDTSKIDEAIALVRQKISEA